MSRRLLLAVALLAGAFSFGPLTDSALACPMCKASTEADDNLPKAYMYSILFMLAIPATIFSGLGYGLYRLNKSEDQALGESELTSDDVQ